MKIHELETFSPKWAGYKVVVFKNRRNSDFGVAVFDLELVHKDVARKHGEDWRPMGAEFIALRGTTWFDRFDSSISLKMGLGDMALDVLKQYLGEQHNLKYDEDARYSI